MTIRKLIHELIAFGDLDATVLWYDCTNEKYATAVSVDTEHDDPEIVMSFVEQ